MILLWHLSRKITFLALFFVISTISFRRIFFTSSTIFSHGIIIFVSKNQHRWGHWACFWPLVFTLHNIERILDYIIKSTGLDMGLDSSCHFVSLPVDLGFLFHLHIMKNDIESISDRFSMVVCWGRNKTWNLIFDDFMTLHRLTQEAVDTSRTGKYS